VNHGRKSEMNRTRVAAPEMRSAVVHLAGSKLNACAGAGVCADAA
jgi:hypothetical protein